MCPRQKEPSSHDRRFGRRSCRRRRRHRNGHDDGHHGRHDRVQRESDHDDHHDDHQRRRLHVSRVCQPAQSESESSPQHVFSPSTSTQQEQHPSQLGRE